MLIQPEMLADAATAFGPARHEPRPGHPGQDGPRHRAGSPIKRAKEAQMHNMLRRMRDRRAAGDFADSSDKGFTLIELLVVVVIIGILIAIAIPLYLNYEKGAKNKSAQSDVRNAVTTVEQCASDLGSLPAAPTGNNTKDADLVFTCSTATPPEKQTANVSSGNTLDYTDNGDGTYTITGVNADGNKTYTYNSADGGTVG